MNTSAIAILVAAGSGRRMGFDKLSAQLAGMSVLERSIMAFDDAALIEAIIVVTSSANDAQVREWCESGRFLKLRTAVAGGNERADSVAAGVAAVAADFDGVIAVHDAARPLISTVAINDVVAAASECGAATIARPIADTLKRVNAQGVVVDAVSRDGMWAMETPQCARADWMREAVALVREQDSETITDEVTALQAAGRAVKVVRCGSPNLKITFPGDVELAERLLAGGGDNA